MKRRVWTIPALVILVAAMAGRLEADEMRRFGLFVGENDGGPGTHRLLYAASDARTMRDVFIDYGGVEARDARLVVDAVAQEVLDAVLSMGKRLQAYQAAGGRATLFFYYSGHADRDGLRLRGTRLPLEQLKSALRDTGADLRIVMLDACQSGQATRNKGGTRAPSFLVEVDRGDHLTGEVIVTSSAADEASQESDQVGGGYFTHHLATGLRGAADISRDGRVTLEEAYAYAYHRTLYQTAGSAVGLQHPGYAADLRGHGTLVLTWPDNGQTVLVFPSGLDGNYLVFDRDRKLFVADLEMNGHDELRIALPAGRYVVQKRAPDHLLTTEVRLTRGVMRQVDERAMTAVSFAEDFAKGVEAANIRRATRVPVMVSGLAGVQRFLLQPQDPPIFASMPMAGIEIEWRDLIGPGWSLSLDVMSGTTDTTLAFDAYDVPAGYWEFDAGVGLKYGRRWGMVRLAGGPHVGSLYVRRTFPTGSAPAQDFMMISPGLVGDLSLRIAPRVFAGLQGRSHLLYYYVGDDDFSLAYSELLGLVTIRF